MLRDVLCVQVLLKSYGQERQSVQSTSSQVIFYYGKCSLPAPYSLTKNELDAHFGWNTAGPVEEVNAYLREQLFAILVG